MSIFTIDGNVSAKNRTQMIKSVQAYKGVLMITYTLACNLQEELSNFCGSEFKWDYIILGG